MTARLSLLAALVLAVAVIPAQPAQAHGALTEACPAPGEIMSVLDTIELGFGDPLDTTDEHPREIFLATNDGRTDLDIGPTIIVDTNTLVATVPGPLEPGIYTVRYQAMAVDGTEYDGGYQFTYDPSAEDPSNCVTTEDGSSVFVWVIATAAVLLLFGLAFWMLNRRSSKAPRGNRAAQRRSKGRR